MTQEKLQKLLVQRDIVTARIRREQGKERTRKRKDDTRRKILAGAAVLERAATDEEFKAGLLELLDRFLFRADDRTLFGLASLPAGAESLTTQEPDGKSLQPHQ